MKSFRAEAMFIVFVLGAICGMAMLSWTQREEGEQLQPLPKRIEQLEARLAVVEERLITLEDIERIAAGLPPVGTRAQQALLTLERIDQ